MDINSTFIFSDYNIQGMWSPWNDSDQVTRNLRYHILSPEEKKGNESSMHRTACWIHTSLSRNLILYSMNPSSNKMAKKILARSLSIPSFVFDLVGFYLSFLIYTPVYALGMILGYTNKSAQTRSLSERKIVNYNSVLKQVSDYSQNKLIQAFASSTLDSSTNKFIQALASSLAGLSLPVELLFNNQVWSNLALPGYKIYNKNEKREEFVLDLSKLDYLRKYCGWEDASEEEVLQFVKTQLETSEPFVEYEIDENNHLKWEFSVLQKPLERSFFLHNIINSANELKILKTCEN